MDYTDFIVDRAQHMRPLEYDLSENHNVLVRYLHDMGVLDNVPVATLGPAEILSASDALAAPLRSLVVGGNSVQDGTPTPAAPVPIQSVVNLALHANDTQGVMWWNQLVYNPDFSEVSGNNAAGFAVSGTSSQNYANGVATIVTSGNYASFGTSTTRRFPVTAGHKYLFAIDAKSSAGDSLSMFINSDSDSAHRFCTGYVSMTADAWVSVRRIGECPVTTSIGSLLVQDPTGANGHTLQFRNPQLFDLTAMFGAGNEPSTVDEFESMFPEPYYPYDEGTWIDGPNWPVMIQLAQPLRSLPDGTRDTVKYAYLRPSTREGWSWYEVEVIHETGQTTQAVTDGITGIVGVDVMSTTGEIADGPIVVYKLATPTTELLPAIELPSIFGPNFTLWGVADETPQLTAQYIQSLSVSMSDMQTAIADIISG
jgi:hypothetical protein